MKKPWYQVSIEYTIILILVLDVLSNVISYFTEITLLGLYAAVGLTALFTLLYYLLLLLLRLKKIKWVSKSGQPIAITNLKKLGTSYWIIFFLIWLGPFYNAAHNYFTKTSAKVNYVRMFNPHSRDFNVLILPFEKECDYEGKKYDIGRVIQKRLESLKDNQGVRVNTWYVTDSIDFRNNTSEKSRLLMKRYHADMILYGAYSLKQCEDGVADKICFNYQVDYEKWGLRIIHADTEYRMFNIAGLDDLRHGVGQENMDNLLFTVSAICDVKDRRFNTAIEKFRRIKDYQQNENVLFQLGNCHFFNHNYDSAEIYFKNTLAIDPDKQEATVHLSILMMQDKKFDEAKRLLEKALLIDPNNFETLRNIVVAAKHLKDTITAKKYADKILAIMPENDSTTTELGLIYRDMGNLKKAKALFERSLELRDRDIEACKGLAFIYKTLKNKENAKVCFLRATTIDSTLVDCWYNAGMVCLEQKDFPNACTYFKKATGINPKYAEGWAGLGDYYILTNDLTTAIPLFEKAMTIDPDSEHALLMAGLAYQKIKQHQKAIVCLERLVMLSPDNIRAWNTLGSAYADLNKNEQALRCFKKLLPLAPGNGGVFYNLASVSSYQRHYARAISYLSEAFKLAPSLKKFATTDHAFDWLRKKDDYIVIASQN